MKLSTASAFLALRFLSEQHLHQASATEDFYAKGKVQKEIDDFMSKQGYTDNYAKDNDARLDQTSAAGTTDAGLEGEGLVQKEIDDFMSKQGYTDNDARDNDAMFGPATTVTEQDQTSAAGTTDAGLRGTWGSPGSRKHIKRKRKTWWGKKKFMEKIALCMNNGRVIVKEGCEWLCSTPEQLEKAGCRFYNDEE